jgi:DNA-binding response OmpR family regulator
LRILIAATDIPFLGEMEQALAQAGYKVIACTDGMEAWDYLASTVLPDLLITSIDLGPGMPPGTALGLHAHADKVPVIYTPKNAEMAGHADPDHGAVLARPFDVSSLVATAQRLLVGPPRPDDRR